MGQPVCYSQLLNSEFLPKAFLQSNKTEMHPALNFLPSSADVFDRHLMKIPRKTAFGILIVYCSYNILLQTEILMYVQVF